MPRDNIITEQKQGRLFEELLSRKLDSNHKLYKLKDLINWSELEAHALSSHKIFQTLAKKINIIHII